jgi:hypothetical protein
LARFSDNLGLLSRGLTVRIQLNASRRAFSRSTDCNSKKSEDLVLKGDGPMKHNLCLNKIIVSLVVLFASFPAFSKVVQSEFLNRAGFGSEGPQLHEIEYSGTKAYLLTYNNVGESPLFRNLTKKEYQKIQLELHDILTVTGEDIKSNEPCDRELVYTKVENEDRVSHSNICWERLSSNKRQRISQWMLGLRKSFQ